MSNVAVQVFVKRVDVEKEKLGFFVKRPAVDAKVLEAKKRGRKKGGDPFAAHEYAVATKVDAEAVRYSFGGRTRVVRDAQQLIISVEEFNFVGARLPGLYTKVARAEGLGDDEAAVKILNGQVEAAEGKIKKLEGELAEAHNVEVALRDEVTGLKTQLAKLTGERQHIDVESQKLTSENTRLKEELAGLKKGKGDKPEK